MKTLLLIDANSLIHRSFHALPPFTAPNGEPTGALYGLSSIFLKIIKEKKPDYWAAAFDRPEPTFRKEIFKDYKIQRPKAPDELISQIIKARELLGKFGIRFFEQPGFEADDLIAALVKRFEPGKDLKIVILTGDLDTLQLVVDDKVAVETPKKGISETVVYDEKAVRERYSLNPEQLPDYKGLAGDSSDNIPGVLGIGPKTASRLLGEYHSLENLYQNLKAKKIKDFPEKDRKLFQKLLDYENQALLSKKLVLLNQDINVPVSLEELICQEPADSLLLDYFGQLGFKSLIVRITGQKFVAEAASSKQTDVLFLVSQEDAIREKQKITSSKLKVGFDLKSLIKELKKDNLELAGPFFDLKIAGWLLDPDQKDCSLAALSRRFIKRPIQEPKEIELFPLLFDYSVKKLREFELVKVFEEIEMPLIGVLAAMETRGVKVDRSILVNLNEELAAEIKSLEEKIYQLAGLVFNLNSPKQLGEVLFEKLKIGQSLASKQSWYGGDRKFSTDAHHLMVFKEEHPIINLILEYREAFKIKSGFVVPIIDYLGDGSRLHTTFNQIGAVTGRLSSEKPNLQNIPAGSRRASVLRRAFEAEPGFSLAAFDYSQIELRILASISGDEKLQQAFFENQDIHKLTASQVFNVRFDEVTPVMRQLGKTLNFGVIYGMGANAFARTAGLSKEKAEDFIEEYFSDFSGVKAWQEETRLQARDLGYVKNLNGRRRWFLEMASPASYLQFEAERAAVNMPVQGLAADIIKMAMIKTSQLGEGVKLLLSIHDELLFEIKDDILEETAGSIKKIMEEIYQLTVPMKVDVKIGKNWGELKDYRRGF